MGDDQKAEVNNISGDQNNVSRDQFRAEGDQNITIHNYPQGGIAPGPQTLPGVWQWYDREQDSYSPTLHLRPSAEGIAIVVSVRGNIVVDVNSYLKKHKLDADIVVVTNTDSPEKVEGLDPGQPDHWMAVVNRFRGLLDYVKDRGSRPIHFFCIGPVALAFALGVKGGGNRHNIVVYQWQGDDYYPIFEFRAGLG